MENRIKDVNDPLIEKKVNPIQTTTLLVILYGGWFICQAGLSMVSPILPPIMNDRNISQSLIGLVIALHPAFQFFTSASIANFIGSRRKESMLFGLTLYIIYMIILDLVYYFPPDGSQVNFVVYASIGRCIGGVGVAFFCVPAYSFLPLLFKKTLNQKVSYMEICYGLGLTGGFLIGSCLFALGGYHLPFYFTLGLLAVLMILIHLYIPTNEQITAHRLQEEQDDQNEKNIDTEHLIRDINREEEEEEEKEVEVISMYQLFTNRKVFSTFLCQAVPNLGLLFEVPTFAVYLDEQFGIGPSGAGYIFGTCTVMYMFMAPLVGYVLERVNKKSFIFFGLIYIGVLFLFLGPDKLVGSPNLTLIICIQTLFGSAMAFIFIPSVPEYYDNLKEEFPNSTEDQRADLSSSLFNTSMSLGYFVGPIIGGVLTDAIGFQEASSLFGLIDIAYGFIYLFTSGLIFQICKSKENKTEESPKLLKTNTEKSHESFFRSYSYDVYAFKQKSNKSLKDN